MKLQKMIDDEEEWLESKGRLFRTVLSLRSRPLRNMMEGDKKYSKLLEDHDVNRLMDLIKELVYSTDESQELVWIMSSMMVKMHNTRQQETESDASFYKGLHPRSREQNPCGDL